MNPNNMRCAAAAVLCGLCATGARAELSTEELAKIAQNPVGAMVSVPLQNNTNFNVGPQDGTQNVLNIQPVVPFQINKDWNLITRYILPLIWQPGSSPGDGTTFGTGDIQVSAMASPSAPTASGIIWGVGAIMQAPSHSNGLGNDNWGFGPQAVILRMEKGSPWVYGALLNNVWSVSNRYGGGYNNFLIQPFLNYNFPGGVYVNSVPIITANWDAPSDQRWTVPLGMGVGKVIHFGKLPVNMQLGGYYNVVRPDNAADWQLRFQMQFMFPK